MGASEIYLWLVDAGCRADGREATNLIPDGSYSPPMARVNGKAGNDAGQTLAKRAACRPPHGQPPGWPTITGSAMDLPHLSPRRMRSRDPPRISQERWSVS